MKPTLLFFALSILCFGQMGMNDPGFVASLTPPAVTGGNSPTPELLWWQLNDGSGTAIAAAVGPAGTTDADWVTGRSGSGYALDFNGTSDDAISNSAITFGVNILTVCFWAYFDATASLGFLAESSANFNLNEQTWAIYVDVNKLWCGIHGVSGNYFRQESIAAPATGAWRHLAIVLDNSTTAGDVKIYLDSVNQTTTMEDNFKSAAATFSPQVVYSGARGGASGFLNGRIDDLRIYSGELSQANINSVYADPQ